MPYGGRLPALTEAASHPTHGGNAFPDLAGRDVDSVESEPRRIHAVVTVGGVLGAETEVLARLRNVLVDPELERCLLRTGEGAR
jgi:hypothetical protein